MSLWKFFEALCSALSPPLFICPSFFGVLKRTDTVHQCTLSSLSALSLVWHHACDASACAARGTHCYCIFLFSLSYFTVSPVLNTPIYLHLSLSIYVCMYAPVFCACSTEAPLPFLYRHFRSPPFFVLRFSFVCASVSLPFGTPLVPVPVYLLCLGAHV